MKVAKFILVFFFLYCIGYAQDSNNFIIQDLSTTDKNFVNFSALIKENNNTWSLIKDNYVISKAKLIKPLSIAVYKVKKGDTVFSIAEQFGLNVDTIISFNSLAANNSINSGDKLLIPSMDGVVIFPGISTSTERIANVYALPESLLLYVNSLNSSMIHAKEEIFIPFARMSDEEKAYFLAKPFAYPLDGGRFTSNYGKRFHPIKHRYIFHGGVDIGTPMGSKVYASADGVVLYAGLGKGYGILVVIQHKYGYTTWYGHLSQILIKEGQKIKQRQLIAYSGNTGISTGPHLHFEIRRFNLRTNPMQVLSFDHRVIPSDDIFSKEGTQENEDADTKDED